MQPTLPITIRRSVWGVLVFVFIWFGINALLYWGLGSSGVDGQTQELLVGLAIFVTAVTGLFTMVGIYLYLASHITFTDEGVEAVRYSSLINVDIVTLEWSNVQLVKVQSGGILKILFGIGSVIIQTAANDDLRLNYVGDIEAVRKLAVELAAIKD